MKHRVMMGDARCMDEIEDRSVNIGDQFARSAFYGRYKVIPIRTGLVGVDTSRDYRFKKAFLKERVAATYTDRPSP